ncbi:MAG: LysR family transcriptional regulator [Pseudomonadaceae bacterium]|nr:MAG: LysR family transcriptional regulator [Pseudomonadaceae bacterium]
MIPKLNFKHLYYFRSIAKDGSIAAASERLDLAPQTLSGQLAQLEAELGQRLFERKSRRLWLTPFGQQVFDYCEAMFGVADNLHDFLTSKGTAARAVVRVGVSASIHKLISYRWLSEFYQFDPAAYLICHTGNSEQQLQELRTRKLDLLLTDQLKLVDELHRFELCELMSSGLSLFASPSLAARLRPGMPQSLSGERLLVNTRNAVYFEHLVSWLKQQGIHMQLAAEIDDSALIKVFGSQGQAIFAAPSHIADEVCRQYRVEVLLDVPAVRDRVFMVGLAGALDSPLIAHFKRVARREAGVVVQSYAANAGSLVDGASSGNP